MITEVGFNDEKKRINLEILMRGSVDGFTARAFHKKCDNKQNVLCVFESDQGYVFGGFTHVGWTSPLESKKVKDKEAWLFSLTHDSVHQQVDQNVYAIEHNKGYLAIFGSNQDENDFYIYD